MSRKCPACSQSVYNDLPGGLCPNCLMAHARKSIDEKNKTRAMPDPSAPSHDTLSRLFPELEIEDMIGKGGMGAVYRVRQKNLDRVVALKVFLYDTSDPEFAARFQREARALAKLNHPNIVTVHDFGQREHLHYLLMEYIDGMNLRQITQAERLDPVEALEMVPQLCDALQYAHDQGVIHRDIKPENLLLDVNGRIKIADFGLAKMTGAAYEGTLTRTRQVMGTLNYMAPEQRERPNEVDHRADIYSLGVVIYEMLTGELPLGRFQPPSSKSTVNSSLDEVVMRALEKEPERRYQQASEFKTGFSQYDQAAYANVGAVSHSPASQPGFVSGSAASSSTPTSYYPPSPPVKSDPSAQFEAPRRRLSIALFSGCDKKGDWDPGTVHFSLTMFGGTCLDLSQVQADQVDITLITLFGGSEVIVPRGARVDFDGLMIFGATDNNVVVYEGYGRSNMRVRIRAFGGFGSAEVRTPTLEECPLPEPQVKGDAHAPTYGWNHFGNVELPFWKQSVVFIYRSIASLVMFAAILCLVLSTVNGVDIDEDDSRLAGLICLVTSIMLWSAQDDFRRLIDAGPSSVEPEKVQKYHSKTIFGAIVHILAFALLFTALNLFVIYLHVREPALKPIAIALGIAAIPAFSWASSLNSRKLSQHHNPNRFG